MYHQYSGKFFECKHLRIELAPTLNQAYLRVLLSEDIFFQCHITAFDPVKI